MRREEARKGEVGVDHVSENTPLASTTSSAEERDEVMAHPTRDERPVLPHLTSLTCFVLLRLLCVAASDYDQSSSSGRPNYDSDDRHSYQQPFDDDRDGSYNTRNTRDSSWENSRDNARDNFRESNRDSSRDRDVGSRRDREPSKRTVRSDWLCESVTPAH